MQRRDFIMLLGGAAAVWPLAARAQQTDRMRRIGVLVGLAEGDSEGQARVAAFRQGLHELKWVEGHNVRIEIRWGAGDAARTSAYAAELVSLAPDVILGTNTPTVRALKQATDTIPIVFAGNSDPVGDGVVASLAKPGGNITGFTGFDAAIAGKWVQLLKEISSGTKRIAVIFNPDTAPYTIFLPVMETVAPQVGVRLIPAPVRDTVAIESAISNLASVPGGGLVVLPDIFMALNRELILRLATRSRLPTMGPLRFYPVDGGLMSYGSNFPDLFRQSAAYVDRILHGEKPSDLPVQAPIKFELVINLKTAKDLGLEVPPSLLARADEVIE